MPVSMSCDCHDFVITGYVEIDENGCMAISDVKGALQNKNPRRCLMKAITLFSCNSRCCGFILPHSGLTSVCAKDENTPLATASHSVAENSCTDFMLIGLAPKHSDDGAFCVADVCGALQPPGQLDGAADSREMFLLSSDHSHCNHFVMSNGLWSTLPTNKDLVWMERMAEVKPGTFFKLYRNPGPVSACELPWDPERRYRALTRSLRRHRGWKTTEHLENLRKSDPLINIHAWHDWHVRIMPLERYV